MRTSKEFDYFDEDVTELEAIGPKQETPEGNEFRESNNCIKVT